MSVQVKIKKNMDLHLLLSCRHPAEEGAGAAGAAGEEGASWKRRGHHPVATHRCGIL